jgi:hypothetical protein
VPSASDEPYALAVIGVAELSSDCTRVSNRVGSIFGNVLYFGNRRAVGPGGSFACCRGSRNSWSIAASPGLRETEKLQRPL